MSSAEPDSAPIEPDYASAESELVPAEPDLPCVKSVPQHAAEDEELHPPPCELADDVGLLSPRTCLSVDQI